MALKNAQGKPATQADGGQEHEREICGRPGAGHPGGAFGIAALPERIVRGAGPADHTARNKKTDEGNNYHAERFAANVGDGVERYLSAERGGHVATTFCHQRVSRFVTGSGKKKDHVRKETDDQVV